MPLTLRDLFEPDEAPTRPDLPNACASRCVHCGQAFGDHVIAIPPLPPKGMFDADCFGMRTNFDDAKTRPADAER